MRKTLIAAAAVLALVAAGCGGGGGGKQLSASEYSSQLNQICADYNTKVKEIGEPSDLAGVADKGPQLLDEFDSSISKAKKLNVPDELSEPAKKFFALSDQQRDLIGQLVDAAKANDGAKVNELGAKIDPISTEADTIAKNELNAPACGQNG